MNAISALGSLEDTYDIWICFHLFKMNLDNHFSKPYDLKSGSLAFLETLNADKQITWSGAAMRLSTLGRTYFQDT
ncbi:predicted protein [Botrytis cinerea T4]|uniref:Uncharacterized protein n=1 Tax=Botryotinia fuckeliana (strain T4) TaxID=999810 RepID=G2XRQ5_BOTF4|nr:predicted protein [Botrytis cinerea T4]